MSDFNKTYIYGKHAVEEALLHAGHSVEKVFLTASFDDQKLKALASRSKIKTEVLAPGRMPKDFDGTSETHQGIIALVSLKALVRPYKEFVEHLEVTPDTCLVLLGELQDPQNVGAVIRSAGAFGIAGVLIPEHNQAPVTGTVVKVSAGMAFRVPLVSVANVNTAVRDLKERGFWIYGLDGEARQTVTKEAFEAPTVFILGNEAKGIREKTRELCDILVSIPSDPRCESLNAAASAAVTLYAWSVKHPQALK